MGQIEQFWCLSNREFSEFFKNGPSFYSSSTEWPSEIIFHKSQFFLGHPVYIWNIVWNRVFILNYVIWIENEWKVTDILLAIDISEAQYRKNCHFIKLWYLKWKGVDRDRTLHLLGLNWTADFSWYSWFNTVLWLVS